VGIDDIHILNEPFQPSDTARQTQEALEAYRIKEHHQGKHPWGSMRRDCPLCVSGKV
jgi:hypothetical protein